MGNITMSDDSDGHACLLVHNEMYWINQNHQVTMQKMTYIIVSIIANKVHKATHSNRFTLNYILQYSFVTDILSKQTGYLFSLYEPM